MILLNETCKIPDVSPLNTAALSFIFLQVEKMKVDEKLLLVHFCPQQWFVDAKPILGNVREYADCLLKL